MVVVDDGQFRSLPATIATARAFRALALGDVPGDLLHLRRAGGLPRDPAGPHRRVSQRDKAGDGGEVDEEAVVAIFPVAALSALAAGDSADLRGSGLAAHLDAVEGEPARARRAIGTSQ